MEKKIKVAILVFIIAAVIYVSAIVWITWGVKLDPFDKTMICFMAITFVLSPVAIAVNSVD